MVPWRCFRITCLSSCGAVRSWAWRAPSCLILETCKTLPYELTSSNYMHVCVCVMLLFSRSIYLFRHSNIFFFGSSGTLTATVSWKMWVTSKLFLLFYLCLCVWHVWVFTSIQLSTSPRFLTQCSGLERLLVAAPPTVALLSTLRNLKDFLLKWRWWVNSVKRREGRAHSGAEEVQAIDLFVSCLCWSAGQTHLWFIFYFSPTPIYNCSCTRSRM